MSNRHYSKTCATLSREGTLSGVFPRQTVLAQAIALALVSGVAWPMSGWAASSIMVSRFTDQPNQNGEMDTYESEPLVGGTIQLKSVNDPPEKLPVGVTVTSAGAGSFNNVEPGQYKVWQYLDPASYLASAKRRDGTPLVKWASEQDALIIDVADNQTINITFPVPPLDLGTATEIEDAKKAVLDLCGEKGAKAEVKLCGDITTTDCPSDGIRLEDNKWTESKLATYEDNIVATFGTISVETNANRDPIKVWGLCNYGTLQSTLHNSLKVEYVELLANYGTIKGQDSDQVYYSGDSIVLTSPNWQSDDPDIIQGIYFGMFYNEGTVQAGKGANSQVWRNTWWQNWETSRSAGGNIEISPTRIIQNGVIKAGSGGDYVVQNYWELVGIHGIPGKGGATTIQTLRSPNAVGTPMFMGVIATEYSETSSGKGGDVVVTGIKCEDAQSSCWREILGGEGGDLTITPEGSSITFKGKAYSGKSAYIEPDMMLSGKDMHITAEEDVVIFGGNGWQLNLANLSDEAIVAGRNIVLAVGRGGKIDLRGNSSKVLKAAGKVQIYANNVLLDNGVRLEDLIDAQEIIKLGDKIIYHANLIGDQQVAEKAGDVLPVNLALHNVGPKVDTYTLSAISQNGWTVSGLPATVTVEGLTQTELNFNVSLPTDGNDVIAVTATSQTDPTVIATMQIQAMVEKPVVVEPEKVALTVTKVGEGTVMIYATECDSSCTQEYDINTNVKLTAIPADGHQFIGWSGDCSSDAVMVTMDAAKNCTATFSAIHYTVNGKLVDPNGAPLANATIQLNGPTATTVTTDTTGTFTLSDLSRGEYTLAGFKDGYTIEVQHVTVNDNVTVTLQAQPIAIIGNYRASGTIKDDAGTPLSGVNVQIGDKTATSDATGHWEIPGLVENIYTAVYTKDGLTFIAQDFELGNGQDAELNISPVTTLKVRVTPAKYGAIPQGDNLGYTLTVLNGGQVTATGITLTMVIPAGATLVSLHGDQATCDLTTATCTVPDLMPGASTQLTLELSNLPSSGIAFANQVSLSANEYPVDVVKTWHKVKPYLSLLGKSQPSPAVVGSQLHYVLKAELLSRSPDTMAKDVVAEIKLSPEVKFLNALATQGTCSLEGNRVICRLGDLSVANSNDISSVTINVDVELVDGGLLQTNVETKVYASNYPEHREVLRTALSLTDATVDGVILLDVTGSMGEELQAVIQSVETKLTAQYADGAHPLIALATFRDSVKLEAASTDLNVLLKALRKLEAKDGGLCPEASAEALTLALEHLKPQGTIIFASDAPPYPGTDVQALKAKIAEKQATFIPILTISDCAANELAQ